MNQLVKINFGWIDSESLAKYHQQHIPILEYPVAYCDIKWWLCIFALSTEKETIAEK